jgi:FkbM family methyltransferase
MSLPNELTANRAELEELSRKRAMGIYWGGDKMLCRLLGTFPAFVDTDDILLSPRLVLDGFWEPWVTLAIARQVQPGMACIDVGANFGYYTLLMAAAVGPNGRVLACEPNQALIDGFLSKNIEVNGFGKRIEICPKVICDRDVGEAEFVIHEGNAATSSLAQWAYDGPSKTVRVPTATIDALTADWPRVDLLKVDAEGADSLVWAGTAATRRRFPAVAIAMELHLQRDPPATAALLDRIVADGYALRSIDYQGAVVATEAAAILANPQEHWTLWLQR